MKMPASRKIWGGLVGAVGGLWLVGGVFGVLQADLRGWLYILLGIVLLRLGVSLFREKMHE